VEKSEGNWPLGRPKPRLGHNNKIDFSRSGIGCMDWNDLADERDRWQALVKAASNLQVP
jgi:hypothetical protein